MVVEKFFNDLRQFATCVEKDCHFLRSQILPNEGSEDGTTPTIKTYASVGDSLARMGHSLQESIDGVNDIKTSTFAAPSTSLIEVLQSIAQRNHEFTKVVEGELKQYGFSEECPLQSPAALLNGAEPSDSDGSIDCPQEPTVPDGTAETLFGPEESLETPFAEDTADADSAKTVTASTDGLESGELNVDVPRWGSGNSCTQSNAAVEAHPSEPTALNTTVNLNETIEIEKGATQMPSPCVHSMLEATENLNGTTSPATPTLGTLSKTDEPCVTPALRRVKQSQQTVACDSPKTPTLDDFGLSSATMAMIEGNKMRGIAPMPSFSLNTTPVAPSIAQPKLTKPSASTTTSVEGSPHATRQDGSTTAINATTTNPRLVLDASSFSNDSVCDSITSTPQAAVLSSSRLVTPSQHMQTRIPRLSVSPSDRSLPSPDTSAFGYVALTTPMRASKAYRPNDPKSPFVRSTHGFQPKSSLSLEPSNDGEEDDLNIDLESFGISSVQLMKYSGVPEDAIGDDEGEDDASDSMNPSHSMVMEEAEASTLEAQAVVDSCSMDADDATPMPSSKTMMADLSEDEYASLPPCVQAEVSFEDMREVTQALRLSIEEAGLDEIILPESQLRDDLGLGALTKAVALVLVKTNRFKVLPSDETGDRLYEIV